MGPRFLGRGNEVFTQPAHLVVVPSMGPRFLGRGNMSTGKSKAANAVVLQWGRAF